MKTLVVYLLLAFALYDFAVMVVDVFDLRAWLAARHLRFWPELADQKMRELGIILLMTQLLLFAVYFVS